MKQQAQQLIVSLTKHLEKLKLKLKKWLANQKLLWKSLLLLSLNLPLNPNQRQLKQSKPKSNHKLKLTRKSQPLSNLAISAKKTKATGVNFKKLQAAEAEVLRQRLSEAEQRKEIPQDYEELKKFRAIFDIKNDPEFKSKYEAPIQSAKESIYGILRKHGAGDEVINSIEEAGGPDKVADSFWKQSAFQKLPLTDSERLKRGLVDVSELKEKQDAEISHAAEHAEEILVQRETQNKEWYGKEVEQIDTYMEEITKDLPWARFVEPLPNATPEQIKQVEDHNKRVGDLATKFNSALWPTTAQERANVAASAVFSHVLTEQLRTEQAQKNALMDQVKQLTSENNKLKGSSKLPKQTVTTQVSNKQSNLSDRIKMNAADAIDLGLDEAGL